PHGVAEAKRLLLPGEAGRARRRQLPGQEIQGAVLLALEQRHFQLELAVEVVLDNARVAPGDEDEVLDAGFTGLVDHVLDQWPVDHWEHLFRHGLGRWQKPGAEACDGENCLADGLHGVSAIGKDNWTTL